MSELALASRKDGEDGDDAVPEESRQLHFRRALTSLHSSHATNPLGLEQMLRSRSPSRPGDQEDEDEEGQHED